MNQNGGIHKGGFAVLCHRNGGSESPGILISYQWDVDKIDQTRYGWLASVENEQLLLRLKKLSKKDLELLTLLFVDGYRQIDVARLWHCSRSAVAQRFKKIKKFLNNT